MRVNMAGLAIVLLSAAAQAGEIAPAADTATSGTAAAAATAAPADGTADAAIEPAAPRFDPAAFSGYGGRDCSGSRQSHAEALIN